MINGRRVAVVMPAYNAEKTLEMTVRELSDIVDIKILVDDPVRIRPLPFRDNLACRHLSTTTTTGTAATSRLAIAKLLPQALTS